MEANTEEKIRTLTGARFFAIFLIVVSHFDFLTRYPIGLFYSKFIDNATLGVDIFFMLSGFGMMYSNMKKNNLTNQHIRIMDAIKFGVAHVRKIYPIYLATIILGIPLYLLGATLEYGRGIKRTLI